MSYKNLLKMDQKILIPTSISIFVIIVIAIAIAIAFAIYYCYYPRQNPQNIIKLNSIN